MEKLKAINTGRFKPDHALLNDLSNIQIKDLTPILQNYFIQTVSEGLINDPTQFLERLAQVIPLEKLEEAAGSDVANILREAKKMFTRAQIYLESTEGKHSPTLKSHLMSILNGILTVMESLLNAFGINDFFKPPENQWESQMKSQRIFTLFHLFGTLSSTLLPLIGLASGGLVLGGIILTMVALSVIWPRIKPMTTYLPGDAKNLSAEVNKGNFVPQGRRESLNEIANILKIDRHAILVGPSRVGKSLTAKAFAKAIENGDYPELAGKVVFRINTSEIIGEKAAPMGGESILKKISNAMAHNRHNVILVLDEIHMACKNKEKIADQLKTYLDENGDFPHVIGITTETEYNEHVKENTAFSLRFDKVDIISTDVDKTIGILSDTILRDSSKPLVEDEVLEQIYEIGNEDPEMPQPAASIKILKKCINLTRKTQKTETEERITELSDKILSLQTQAAAYRSLNNKFEEKISQYEQEKGALEKLQSEHQKELNLLFKSKELLDRVTSERYRSILEISKIAQGALNTQSEKQLKMYLLLQKFLETLLKSFIKEKSNKVGVKMVVDTALVKQVTS